MDKKLKKNKIRFISLFIILFSVFLLLNINFIVTVNASQTLICNWDNVASGLDNGTDGLFAWVNLGPVNTFETSTDYDLSSPNSIKVMAEDTDNLGYWNLTVPFSYIGVINFSYFTHGTTGNHFLAMEFYNGSNKVINIQMVIQSSGTTLVYWYDVSSGTKTLTSAQLREARYYFVISHNGTNQFNIKILNSSFAIQVNTDYAGSYAGDYSTFEYIKLYGYNFGGGNSAFYFDNFYIDTTPISETESGCMTYDDSYYSVGTGMNYYTGYTVPTTTVEFVYPYKLDGTIKGFELFLPVDVTDEITNWYLYINGVFQTSASCCYAYGSGWKLQFNDLSQNLVDDYAIIDIYRGIGGSVPLLTYPVGYQGVQWSIYAGSTDIINDILDGGVLPTVAQYIIYYNINETIVTDCDYDNDIAFTNIVDDQEISTFKTVFFSVTVDNTTVPYKKIVVNKDGTNLSIQNYPKDITKCSDIYSFTPIETGTYYICLSYNGVNVSGTFHFFNVTSVTTKLYNIFTTPNPSEYGQEITVTTFIDDTGVFAVCLFSSSESTVDYDSSLYTTFVDVGWYNYTFTYLSTLSGITNYYFRIFKQVADIYSPVGEIYIHYIRYVSKESYIDVAHPSVLIREDIGIFGNNAEVIIRVGIFNDATLIFDNVPSGFFHFSKTYDSVGTHVISLKKYVNDQWILVDSVQVIVSTPPSGDDGFFGIPIPNLRGTSMGYLIGLIIVFVFIILPMRIQKGLHIKQSLPPFVYIFTGLMGIVTSTVLPFFDVWILAFIIIMSLIYLVAKYLVGSGTTSEE